MVVSSGNVLEISSLVKESWIVTSPIKLVAFSNGTCRNMDIGMCGNVSPQDAFKVYLFLIKGKISACSSTGDNSRLLPSPRTVGKVHLEQYPFVNSKLILPNGIITEWTCLYLGLGHPVRVRWVFCGA